MAWAKLDDGYATHPKVIQAGVRGLALDVAGMAYAARHLTDGFIADGVLAGLYPPIKQARRVAERLVEVGRWQRDDERQGWWIHDYLSHNFSAEATAKKKAVDRERATRAAEKRWANERRTPKPEDAQLHASEHSSEHADKHVKPDASSRPVPSEVNLPLTPTPDGAGEPKRIPRNSRAHGTSPRQLAAQEEGKQRERNRVGEFERLGRKIRNAGKSRDVLMDLLQDKQPLPEELEAALTGFNDPASGTDMTGK